MDTKAYMDEFKVRFAKLKSNREKIPLEQLTETDYIREEYDLFEVYMKQ